jgi:hypothetical protein
MPGEGSRSFSKAEQTGGSLFARKAARIADAKARERKAHQEIDARDNHTCRICGRCCSPMNIGRMKRGERHHMRATDRRSKIHLPQHMITLCGKCHDAVERSGKLRISGDANLRAAESGKLCGVKCERMTETGWKVEKWC